MMCSSIKAVAALAMLSVWPLAAQAESSRINNSPDYVMMNPSSRTGLDLSGSWAWSIDPYRDGLSGFHGGEAGIGHRRFDPVDVEAATRDDPAALFEYDMRNAERTTLPGSWNTEADSLRHYNGLMWYTRNFSHQTRNESRYFIRIEAANYTSRLYLNGAFIGSHEGGFTPATYEVTQQILNGSNDITIGVDSARTPLSVPPPVTDWETYGGITREVRLIEVPQTFIDDAWVRLTRDGRVAATVQLNGIDGSGQSVYVKIPELELTLTGKTDVNGVFDTTAVVPKDLVRWSPENPKLYPVIVTAGHDTLNERIGFRTIEVNGLDILLNGEPIFLRGISMHEEELGIAPARVMSEASARALLTEIKEGLNGNFVRLAHYPHSESTLRLADEIGLLVWSEVPVYWLIEWENEATLHTASSMLAESIHRDRNRASIILWSVANETPVSAARNRFLKTLISDARRLDGTRLVTAALLTSQSESDGIVEVHIDDPLAEWLDVMSVNTYNGWYGDMPLANVHALRWTNEHGKPLLFSEFGAGALAGFHDPSMKRKFSEDYQAEYYRQTLAMAEQIPSLRGMSPWILKDFQSPRRQHPVYQNGWNRKGLISETGRRKEAFYILAHHYAELESHVPP